MTAANPTSPSKSQIPIYLIGCGHGATHWIAGTFVILLPAITKDLGLSYFEAGLLVSILHISAFAANLGSGVLVDLTGRKVIFQVVSLVVGAVALAGFGLTGLYGVLAALIVLIGATNNLWHPPAIAFIAQHYGPIRGYALAIHATGASVGDMVAPLAAGALLAWFGWGGVAAINAVPVLIVAALCWFYLAPRDRPAAGIAAARTGFGGYIAGLSQLVRQRAVLGLCLMASLRSMAQTGLLVFLPLFLSDVLKVTPVVMGVAITAMHLGGAIVSPIAGALSDRIGRRPVVMGGLGASTLLIAALTLIGDQTVFVASVSVLGFVLYAVRPVIHAWMMDLAPADMRGSATSLLFGTQSALSVLIPMLGGAVADAYGLREVFYLIAAIMALANLAVFALPRPKRP